MSEYKKRSRKSKLKVRDVEDTENAILQITFPSVPKQEVENVESPPHKSRTPPLPNFDHTYARPNLSPFTSTVSFTSLSTPSTSGLHLSVKVEVEQLDESIFNEVLSPHTPLISKNDKQNARNSKAPQRIHIFEIDKDEMFKISDSINLNTTNLADKFLSVEVKNIWGHMSTSFGDDDPYNDLVQKALFKWSLSMIEGSLKKYGDIPLFYQCYICKLAWWYLEPFRVHIRTHDHTKIKINYKESDLYESFIYADDRETSDIIYIPCEGNCHRCERPYSFHVKPPNLLYICKSCFYRVYSCALLKQHESVCYAKKTEHIDKKKSICIVCQARFYTKTELFNHMTTVHDVRSDYPVACLFRNCASCKLKYVSYDAHMCMMSALSSPCQFCSRRFHTKLFQMVHHQMREENYPCKICGVILSARCQETEHMLEEHTDNFRYAYRCRNSLCPPTALFPDLASIRLHKKFYHGHKLNSKKKYYDKVVVPERCVKLDYVQVLNEAGHTEGIKVEKLREEPEFEDWCVANVTNKQTDSQPELYDDVIVIEPEPQEPIVIDSQDDSEDGQMDYAAMLSKVFKVSDSTTTQRPRISDQILSRIKIEPVDSEMKINIEEESVKTETIKQEPTNNLDRSIEVQNVTQSDCSANDDNQIDCKGSISQTDFNCGVDIKTEPEDYEIDLIYDNGIVAINIEPKDIKKEMLEITDTNNTMVAANVEPTDIKKEVLELTEANDGIVAVDIEPKDIKTEMLEMTADEYTGDNVVAAEDILAPKVIMQKRFVKKISLLKDKITEVKVTSKNPKSLLKKNIAKNENYDVKVNHQKKDSNSKTKGAVKLPSKRKLCDGTTKTPKVKVLKFDENGIKMKRLYKCARCGYQQSHRLFRLHQKSSCTYCPSEDKANINRFKCTKCDTEFCSLKAYLVHFPKHGYEILHCPCCNMKFEVLKDIIPHFQQHVKQNYVNCWMINDGSSCTKKQHRCQICRDIVSPIEFFAHWEAHFQLKMEKKEHQEIKISDVIDSVTNNRELQPSVLHLALQQLRSTAREKVCVVCTRKFSRRYDMKRHLIEHLLMDAYSRKDKVRSLVFRCQICLKEFQRPDRYKYHMREHGGLPDYRCEICNKSFSDSSNFAKHKKIHNMGVMICDICKKKFQAKSSLEKHMIIHLTTDPINCGHCERKFYSRSLYNKHINLTHRRGVKLRCVQCDLTFTSSREKWDHAWRVHNQRKLKADCPICNQEFRKYQDVRNHARNEHGMELSFYKIKMETGDVNNVKFFEIKTRKAKAKSTKERKRDI